jgi:chromosomal replication initiation ATPase DnaA
MLAEELIDTMDYLREVETSVTRPLGTTLWEAQLRELDRVIRRLGSFAGWITDPDRVTKIKILMHQAKTCRCRIQNNLMSNHVKRNCVMARVA